MAAHRLDFTEEDRDAVVDTNLKSLFFLCQAAGRHMIGQGRGKIVNIASMLSFQSGIRVPSYTASKSGVAGLTKLRLAGAVKLDLFSSSVRPELVEGPSLLLTRCREKGRASTGSARTEIG